MALIRFCIEASAFAMERNLGAYGRFEKDFVS
jgi:hypothetical protein